MRKKLFTFLLALVTSVGLMNAAVDDSGSCGANVTYSFNGATGAMTITGTGPMTDFASISEVPWNSYRDDITSVTITDGVTSVGSNSFGYHENLVTVTIGNDVETIGYYAFGDCYKFTTLNLGNSVRHIGNRAFMWAKVLTGFTLPSTLETIGERAFLQNKVITSLTIPSNVTSIGEAAFFYCAALTSVTVEATTPPTLGATVFDYVPTSSIPLYVPNGSVAAYDAAAQWTDFNIQGYDPAPTPANVCGDGLTWELNGGVLTISYDGVGTGEMYDFGYEYDQNPVNVAPWKENKSAITTVIVGDGVKSIGNYAFNDLSENFTAVTIANSVERIGVFAFTNSEEITAITLPSSLKTIDDQGFANCGFTSITIPSGVTSIGYKAFSWCRKLTSLTCEATTPPTLGTGVFNKIRSTTSSISSIPLYVPSGSVAAYKAAAQWNAFDIQGYDPAPATPTVYNSGSVALSNLKVGDILMAGVTLTDDSDSKVKFVPSRLKFMGNIRTSELTLANFVSSMQTPLLGENAAMTFSGGAITITPINEEGKDGNAWVVTEINVAEDTPVALAGITYSGTTPTPTPTGEQVPTNADPENPSYHYSTFFHSTQNYKLSNDGTQAFIADLSNNELVLTEIAHGEQVIPANTAVILRKTGSADPVVLIPTQENGVIINPDDNSLRGVDEDKTLESLSINPLQCYVLSGKSHDETESGVGFYLIHGNTLKAHKAYVKYVGGQSNAPKKMRFVYGQATGIEDVQGNNVQSTKVIENGVLYIIRDGKTYNAMGQMVK